MTYHISFKLALNNIIHDTLFMARKKIFNITVYETKNFEVNQDWECPITGFFIIASKHKLCSFIDLSDEEAQELMQVIMTVRKAMKQVLHVDHVYFFQEESNQFPFHVWILPHYPWMDSIATGPEAVAAIWEHATKQMNDNRHKKQVDIAAEKVKQFLK